jgi:hypothetical protein
MRADQVPACVDALKAFGLTDIYLKEKDEAKDAHFGESGQ